MFFMVLACSKKYDNSVSSKPDVNSSSSQISVINSSSSFQSTGVSLSLFSNTFIDFCDGR